MVIDPEIVGWLLIGAASFCAFMIGKHYAAQERDLIIENTIEYLIDQGFLKSRTNQDGEVELIHLESEDNS